jgi:hypothetical protein
MRLAEAHLSALKPFEEFHRAPVAPGALDTRSKELKALAFRVTD